MIAGGGTGGHLFPALAVADELRRRGPDREVSFVGSRRGLETRIVPPAGYPLRTLPLSGLKGSGLLARGAAVAAAALGVLRCALWMSRRRPDLVIGVGGYASGPAVAAARLLGVSTMLMEQNHYPGATNRWLARWTDAVCVPSEAAGRRIGGTVRVTGNPVRPAFASIGPAPGGAVLSLLVFGGSRGARSINRAVAEALPLLASLPEPPRIVHQTGTDERPDAGAYPSGRYEAHAFLEDMPARLEAADLVVCRAGATTLAELAAAGRPAILVPYPHAADDHQLRNAEEVASNGAAVVVPDDALDGPTLAATVRELSADPERRRRMGEAARRSARPEAVSSIADVAESLLREEGGGRVP